MMNTPLANDLPRLFTEYFHRAPAVLARAPGRLEILGNHTDYNEGLVLSAATAQVTSIAMAPRPGALCAIADTALPGKTFTINLEQLDNPQKGDWTNYLKGVLVELKRRGKTFGAFDLALGSDLPLSAGMSSSAALEMAFCYALGSVYNIDLPQADWARVGQAAENRYLGLKSGLLDQFSSLFGQKDALILCDFRKEEVQEIVPVPAGYGFLAANTMVKHNLVESDYNLRRASCERVRNVIASRCPKVTALRDVDGAMLEKFRSELDATDYRRALHVIGENDRALAGVKALRAGDIAAFGQLLYASHESSRMNFENSCPELDALVEIARSLPECLGARLSGGGFGGITIHLIKLTGADTYQSRLSAAYRAMTGKEITTILCAIGDGAVAEQL